MDGREHFFDGYPLEVNLHSDGVNLNRNWNPGNANPNVGAAAVVVSKLNKSALKKALLLILTGIYCHFC